MTCSACHTRQIEVGTTSYRIDGGPAISDFQSFMADIDEAVGKLLSDNAGFATFAVAVLGGQPTTAQAQQLHQDVAAWYAPYHTIVSQALPPKPWGPGRLDAVGMIFNRLSGLDIGTTPDHIKHIAQEVKKFAPRKLPVLEEIL